MDRAQLMRFFAQGVFVGVVEIRPLTAVRAGGHLQDADLHAQQMVNRAHPAPVAPSQIVVDGDKVRAFAFEGVQVERQGGGQGFALACAQLGDAALVQVDAADELHVVVAHAQGALAGFAHGGKGFGQERVQAFAIREARAEFVRFGAQGFGAEGFEAGFEGVNRVYYRDHFGDGAFVLVAGEEAGNFLKHKAEYPLVCSGGL